MRSTLVKPVTSFFFCLTGVGTALLGAALPAILHQWRMDDQRGGFLLLCAWAGSTVGALFAQGRDGRGAAVGLALSAAGALGCTLWAGSWAPWLFGIYGVGLGVTMTSISLMRARAVSGTAAGLEFNRLNLLWAVGALCAPTLALHSLQRLTVLSLFRGMGVAFALCAAAALLLPGYEADRPAEAAAMESGKALAPLRFGLFAAAAVGLESAIGSWLTTYSERSAPGVLEAVSANSGFWAGLLLSRAASSLPWARFLHTRLARAGHLVTIGVALAIMLLAPTRHLLPVAGLLCGLGLGPLYPWVLSVTVPHFRSKGVFVLAGLGASFVPWMTGALSSASGALRIGLLAPAVAFVCLAALAVRMHPEEAGTAIYKTSLGHDPAV